MEDNPRDPAKLRDDFERWWRGRQQLPAETPGETLARSAWDAGVRAAVVVLYREVYRLVGAAAYHEAAATRDARQFVQQLFTSPDQWSEKEQTREDFEAGNFRSE